MFKVGDRIVYPSVGVGKIEAIVERKFGDVKRAFYKVIVDEKHAQLMIPVDGTERIGVRPLVNSKLANELYDRFAEAPDLALFKSWSKRFRTYEDRLKTGDPFEIVEVLRDLMLQAKRKELSFGEKKVLEQARGMIVRELAFSTRVKEETVLQKVRDRIEQAWSTIPSSESE